MKNLVKFNESEKFLKIKSLIEHIDYVLVELKDDNISYKIDPSNDIRVKLASLGKDGYFSLMINNLEDKKDSYSLISEKINMIVEYLDNNGFDIKFEAKCYRNYVDYSINEFTLDKLLSILDKHLEIGWIQLNFIMRDKPVYEGLPNQKSIEQLERVMKLSAKTDIGNRISDMNKQGANIHYMHNAIENGVESFEEYESNNKKRMNHLKSFNEYPDEK